MFVGIQDSGKRDSTYDCEVKDTCSPEKGQFSLILKCVV